MATLRLVFVGSLTPKQKRKSEKAIDRICRRAKVRPPNHANMTRYSSSYAIVNELVFQDKLTAKRALERIMKQSGRRMPDEEHINIYRRSWELRLISGDVPDD